MQAEMHMCLSTACKFILSMHVCLCVHVCKYMDIPQLFVSVCEYVSTLSVEQSREHKTDHTVTAHFPAHYQQQGLMGAYNEGPCLGQVTVEHSPNSTHPSFSPFPSPFPHSLNIQPPSPLLYATLYPQRSSDPVCPPAPPFCPFFILLSASLHCLSPLSKSPAPRLPPIPVSHLTFMLSLFLASPPA